MDSWQEPQTLATYLAIVLVFVGILISAIIIAVRLSVKKTIEAKENAARLKLEHQQRLLENSIQIQERERERIAADIHDELIGKLTAIKMVNQMNENSLQLDQLLDKSISIARNISHDLRPPLIEYTTLNDLIEEIVLPWKSKIQIQLTFNIADDHAVSTEIKIHFIRIIQEVLVNIIKHSKATLAGIHLRVSRKCIGLVLSDNGTGFDQELITSGLGLSNIETRIQYMKGRYKLKSRHQFGTRYIISIPRNRQFLSAVI